MSIYSILPPNRNTLEFEKFELNKDGEVIVRTSAEGTFEPSGLTTIWVNTTIDVSTTAVKIPSTNLVNRNAISIHNTDSTKVLYLGPTSSVTADSAIGNTSGRQLGPGNFINFDIKDSIDIYAIAVSGTIRVHIMEIA